MAIFEKKGMERKWIHNEATLGRSDGLDIGRACWPNIRNGFLGQEGRFETVEDKS